MTGHPGSPLTASPWVLRHLPLIPTGGRVLDLAAGGGRHTRLARGCGFHVTALDRDVSALRDLPDVEVVAHDLEIGAPLPFGERRFEGIVVTNYLWRPLLPLLPDLLAPAGVLVYETFAHGHERFGKPTNPDFLLAPGELLDCVRGRLRVLAYEELEVAEPRPAKVQRIAAIREWAPAPSGVPPGTTIGGGRALG
ncbi:MAG: class I SAM-dependent methyltransferase [Alphaproteobacteria bacterium]|nr:class I SAM-dependent methyltransferase [Alphaproteobacteria bacterium]